MAELIKEVVTNEAAEGYTSLIKTKATETYKVYDEEEVNEMLDEAKNSTQYNLVGHAVKHKEAKIDKKTGDVKIGGEEHWLLTLKKEF